jgi:hypothetical protein
VAPLERALAIAEARHSGATDRARVQLALARALAANHRDAPRVHELVRAGRAAFMEAQQRWGGENARFADELAGDLR